MLTRRYPRGFTFYVAYPHSLHCISAAPAALDRYLAALPAMSLIPVAPFCSTAGAICFLVIRSDWHTRSQELFTQQWRFLWSLRRRFISRLDCVLLGHVFALPRRAVKTRAFPVVKTCLGVNPDLAMASAGCGRVGHFLGRAPCRRWAYGPTRCWRRLDPLGSGFCFGRSRWRLSGWRRCGGRLGRAGWLSLHNADGGKSDYRNDRKKFRSHSNKCSEAGL